MSHSTLIIGPSMIPQIFVEVQSNLRNITQTIFPSVDNYLTCGNISKDSLINERHIVIQFSAHVHCQHTFDVLRKRANLSAHDFVHHRGVLHSELLWPGFWGVNCKNLSVIVNWIPHDRLVAKIINIVDNSLRFVQGWHKRNNQKWKVDQGQNQASHCYNRQELFWHLGLAVCESDKNTG